MSLPVFRLMEKLVVGLKQADLWPARGGGGGGREAGQDYRFMLGSTSTM